MQGAVYKDLAAGGPVGDGKLLVRAEELNGVGAGHGAAPEGMNAYLARVPLAAVALPAIDRCQLVLGVDGVQQELGGAAGGVRFLIVVDFSTPLTACRARMNTATPREKLALHKTGA